MNLHLKEALLGLAFTGSIFIASAQQKDERLFVNLGSNVNTTAIEINPHISADGKTLYFIRDGHEQNENSQDIWYAELGEDGKWKPAQRAVNTLNASEANSVVSVSPDGNRLMVKGDYRRGKLHDKGYSFSQLTKTGWNAPKAIKIEHYSALDKGLYDGACTSADEKVLIFSMCSTHKGTDNDLYVSVKKEDGSYTHPQVLGANINTKGSMDFSPFLASDNHTLYFASDRPGGLGLTDIYKTTRLDDSFLNWSDPVNMGPKINSAGKEGYYTLDAKGTHAYMVSDVNSIGLADIVTIVLEEEHKPKPVVLLRGNVFDVKTKKAIDARIEYHEYPVDTVRGATNTDHETGTYSIIFPYEEKYIISARAHGYVTSFDTISFPVQNQYSEVVRDFQLTPIIKGEKVVLKHVNFETNKAILDTTSFIELDKVAEFLIENPEVKIMIGGHTDNAGVADKNLKLSDARAKTVMNYLLTKNVKADRLTSKGFGQTQPIVANDSPERMRTNRRVEFTITEE